MKKVTGTRPHWLLLALLGVIALAGCDLNGKGGKADGTSPLVISTIPVDLATAVALNSSIRAKFSEAMDGATITAENFMVIQCESLVNVEGTVTYDATTKTAIFMPTGDLAANSIYTVTIDDDVEDDSGMAMGEDKIWMFTTGTELDTAPPTLESTIPLDAATGVALNGNITVTFDETIDPLSVTDDSFTLVQGTTPVAGQVAYAGNTLTFNPDADLSPDTVYAATIAAGIEDLFGNIISEDSDWTFTTGSVSDETAPATNSTSPAGSAVDVGLSADVTAVFGEAMDPATINETTFTLFQGTTPVPGTVSYDGTTATFNPDADLAPGTVYTATITLGAKDLADNSMASPLVWTFTTNTPPDITAPTVVSTIPLHGAENVIATSNVSAVFSEAMDPLTITNTTVTLKQGSTDIAGTVSYAGTTVTFNPDATLANNTLYTATITTGAKDLAANGLATAKVWTFTTGILTDTIHPTVVSTIPAAGATGVALNTNASAVFSEAMDPLSVTGATVTLKQGSTNIAGSVSYSGTTVTFNPGADLAPSTLYTATITTGAKDLAENILETEKVWTFTTGAAPDAVPPYIVSTIPANEATGVNKAANVSAIFSEAMNPLTVTNATVTLKQGSTNIAGTVSYAGTTVTFNPGSDLASLTLYTATITTGAKDLAGNALATAKVWSFTTEDTTAPTVNATAPAAGETEVAISVDVIANFSEEMMASTVTATTFYLKQGTANIAGTVTMPASGTTATFNPSANLAYNTLYTATVTTEAQDLAGNNLAATKVWSFTTLAAPDTQPPTVDALTPQDGATGVPLDTTVSGTFDEPMDSSTVNGTTFTLSDGTVPVAGTVTYDPSNNKATFTPAAILTGNTEYTATITTGNEDLAGNALAVAAVWHFTTLNVVALGPQAVSLGTAGNYVILAKSAISTVPTSVITGNVGLSPAAESYLTGFSQTDAIGYATSTQVVAGYKMYAADMAEPTPGYMTTAISDMEAAYTATANRVAPTSVDSGAGTIGGTNFVPGLYKWNSTVTIPTSITLNGGANDVWIFQITGDLSIDSAQSVLMTGGAQAKNVFWQVAGQVFLGTTSHFEGTILCYTQIVFGTGASLTGRALAQTAVVLDQNVITKPDL